MNRRLIALAVAAFALTGCIVKAPDGPPGVVKDHFQYQVGKPAVVHKGITVKAKDGTTTDIETTWDQRDACSVGEKYPACLPKES